ncbi:ribosomal protein S18 acetylase RimI-like enzyme [Fontibacillus solani]|uniref:Ribosomal protein S18 acetylase RimI-like enzyme n=1 Tax=Fontibacillus solani TaxID=1572857 RepID=A0A7W3SQI8_9BACL|nr:GNAT family N-acetyltransferase [Fontibacillus solani]MBA9084249.1 ribosomal protein S18 acetylase RimI-like enzyme [Fontibacillus solani]
MNNKMIEELSLNNWPALSTLLYDGWVLRFANGYTKRANSINPIHYSTCNLEHKIAECEQIYTLNNLPAIYKITPFIHPVHLDHILENKGYSLIDLSSILTLNLDHIREPSLDSVKINTQRNAEWVDHFCRLNQVEDKNRDTMEQMLSNIKTKKGFISLYYEGKVVACGLGVIEREYIGLYDIITDIEYRNRGFGEQLLLNLLKWGCENGAKYSYLAVVMNNIPALQLYSKIGYLEAYRYWYRVKDTVSC